MYQMSEATKASLNNLFSRGMGMSLDQFSQLPLEEQASLFEQQRQHRAPKKTIKMRVGSGETAMTLNVQSGSKVMLTGGTIIRAGANPESERLRVNSRIDKIIAFKSTKKEKSKGLLKKYQ